MAQTTETRLQTLEIFILIAIGGFTGASLRGFLSVMIPGLGGIFVANILGCLALGFFTYEAEYVGILSDETGYVVSIGFLSSFTTYSTFALQTVQTTPLMSTVNIAANYGVGFAAVIVGRTAVKTAERKYEW